MTLPIQMQKTPVGIAGGKENGNLALKFPFFFHFIFLCSLRLPN
mgnify:CR=1 FL=1